MTVIELKKPGLSQDGRRPDHVLSGQIWGTWREEGGFETHRVLNFYINIDRLRVKLVRLSDSEVVDYSERHFRAWFYHESEFLRLEEEEAEQEIKKWRRAFNAVVGRKMMA
jgi:hypothetical protein